MMKPIGWTADRLRARCEECGEEATLDWDVYLDAIGNDRAVRCDACGAEQPMEDRRQRDVPVAKDRRRAT